MIGPMRRQCGWENSTGIPKLLGQSNHENLSVVVLDTDHLSALEWETDASARKLLARLSQLSPDEAVTTIINFEEQMRGLARLPLADADARSTS